MGLFLPRQSIYAPLGLVTQPNKYAQYPSGACAIARNFVLRNPGELVQAPGTQATVAIGSPNDTVHKLMPLDGGAVYSLRVNGTTWAVDVGAIAAVFPGSATNAFSATGRNSWARVAERIIINGRSCCMVGDFMQPTNGTEAELREAGMPAPRASFEQYSDPAAGWILHDQMVGYAVCFVREFSNGYTLRSVPSTPFKIRLPSTSASNNYNPRLRVSWPGGTIKAGDKVEIYRTDTLSTTSDLADPGETFKLVQSYTLSSAEAAGTFVLITDAQPTPPGSLVAPGRELYSNPAQEGAEYANRKPPIAKCVESFKGFAFYGNTTERAVWEFAVPGGLGDESQAVASGVLVELFKARGIGIRRGAGTVTSGSNTITGVSAANMVGVKVGQQWRLPSTGTAAFPTNPPTTVTSVGATTITMSANATASGAAWALTDVFELDGVLVPASSAATICENLGSYEVGCSASVPFTTDNRFLVAFDFSVERVWRPLDQSLTVRATNGANYSPPIPELSSAVKTITASTRKNRIQWSKEQQPEHCPAASELFAGFGELYAMNSTRDALWLWCSDGLFRLSGHAGALGLGAWQVDYANSTLVLAAPQASCVLNEFLYAYTNVGFVEVDSAGNVINLTDKIIGDLLPGQKYSETASIVVERNETDEEVLLILGESSGKSNTVYVFNTKQRGWTTLGSNGAELSNITALAMQRSPASGEPRVLFGVSPAGGVSPSYSGWNSASVFLAAEVQYQPIYGDDPLELKRWLWADYLFDMGSNGKTIVPRWNGTQYGGTVAIQSFDQGGYARAGCPREVGSSQSVSPGFSALSGAPQSRFQGLSVPVKQRTNQSKKR